MFFDSFFSASRHCVDAQCDTDAAAGVELTPGAADAAEQLSDYMRLVHARPSVPPAPAGSRPEQRLRTFHPIPQRAEGEVVVVNGLPASLREVGFAIYMSTRGGISAADVAEARTIAARRPHQYPQTASIPAGYQLPAAARTVFGDDISTAITGAAAVYYAAHEYTAYLQDRRARAAKYGVVTPIAPGVIINGGAPDNQAKGAIPLSAGEEKLLKKWIRIRDSEAWLEDSAVFKQRQAAWDTAARARQEAEAALAAWKTKIRLHPMREAFKFDV